MEFLQWEGPDKWDASDSDRSCKTTELRAFVSKMTHLTLDLPKGPAKCQEMLGPFEDGMRLIILDLSFWFVAVTSSIHMEFSPASLGKQAKHSSLSREFPPWEWWGDSGGPCHAWETSCSWLKPLWWFHSAPPALVGIIADPQEVGEKPTQVSFKAQLCFLSFD